MRGPGGSDSGGGGEQSDAGDLSQVPYIIAMFGELVYFALDVFDLHLELFDIVEHHREGRGEGAGEFTLSNDFLGITFGVGGALGDGVTEFAQEPAKAIDEPVTGGFELFADAVQLLELLLFDRANWHRLDAFASVSFEQGSVSMRSDLLRRR